MNKKQKNTKKKLKIAIIYDFAYPFFTGGTEIRNYELAKLLAKKGHEIHFFCVKLWTGSSIIKKNNFIYHGICRYHNKYSFDGHRKIYEPLKFALKLYPKLQAAIKKYQINIIDCSTFPFFPYFTCSSLAKKYQTPLITTWHQYFNNFWKTYFGKIKGTLACKIENLVKNLSINNVSVSKKTQKDLNLACTIVENGINLKEIKQAKKSKQKYDFIYLGRLCKGKNLELLLFSFAEILKQNSNKNLKLAIIGDGYHKQKLENLAKKLNIEKNVFFLGLLNQQQAYPLLKSSKIFAFPSLLEGFGMSVLEAMACGLPTITVKSKHNASYMLVQENNSGLVVENNIQSFSQAMNTLLKNSSQRKKFSANAKKAAQKYTWQKAAKKLEKLYLNLAHSQSKTT